jgi:hypothetical protein
MQYVPVHQRLELLVVLVLAGVFLIWMAVERPFDVPPLTDSDQADLSAQQQWPLLVSETFDTPQGGSEVVWQTGVENTAYHQVTREIRDGQWIWSGDFSTEEDCCRGFSVWYFPQPDLDDFWLQVDFARLNGHQGASYGLVYHFQDLDNFYIATINDIGNGGINVFGQGEWEALLTPRSIKSIMRMGGPNTIQISVQAGHAIFFINGNYFGQIADNRVSTGKLGLIMPKPYDGGQIQLAIDNIQLRAP